MTYRALDLFCGAGGATKGLQCAGFHVTGVDIKRQPHYCGDAFVQADALKPPLDLRQFDFIWASPPCQAYSQASKNERSRGVIYPDLIEPVRRMLAGHPMTCIENVPGAPLRPDLRLHGVMFPPLRVIRERLFELSFFATQPDRNRPRGLLLKGFVSVAGHGTQGWAYKMGLRWNVANMREAMGIDWMTRAELSQAIPPAYSDYIGRAAIRHLDSLRSEAA